LWQAYGTVSGTVGDSSWGVSVNGVQAEVSDNGDGTGHWEADNVPIYGMGTATFDAVATPPGQENQSRMRAMNSGSTTPPPAILSLDVEKGPAVKVVTYYDTKSASATQSWSTSTTGARTYNANYQKNNAGQWFYGYKGTVTNTYFDDYWPFSYENDYKWSSADTNVYYDQYTEDGTAYPATPVPIGTPGEYGYPVTVEMDEDAYEPPTDGNPPNYSVIHYFANNVQWNWTTSDGWKWNMNVDARTTTKLLTGGKAQIARRNLIQLQCDGVEYGRPCISPDISWPWVGVQRTPLDKSRMRALGQWVGADGNLWVSLPDNAAMDLNVSAPARHYYAWATPTKYRMHIVVNANDVNGNTISNPLFQDHVPSFNTYCVGQYLNFSAEFRPAVPGLISVNPTWILPGTYVNDHDTGDAGCEIYGINVDLSTNNPTPAWYYSGRSNLTASAGLNCTFANGQKVYVYSNGKFNVFTPAIQFYPEQGTNAVVEVRHGTGIDSAATLLGIGDDYQGFAMRFSATIGSIQQYPGNAIITQLINRQESADGISLGTGGASDLDNDEIYSQDSVSNNPIWPNWNPTKEVTFFDQPGIGLSTPVGYGFIICASCDDHFNTYFRFKPDGDADNIYVTLGRVDWDWHGIANYIGWSPLNPYPLTNWQVSGAGICGPTFYQVNDFPIWPAVYNNSLF
jgi:hypothetical protein